MPRFPDFRLYLSPPICSLALFCEEEDGKGSEGGSVENRRRLTDWSLGEKGEMIRKEEKGGREKSRHTWPYQKKRYFYSF